jgi:hypothetical protein
MAEINIEAGIAPLGGLNFSLPPDLIASTDMSDCENVFFEDGFCKKRFGYSQFGNNLPLPGVFVGSDQFYLFSYSAGYLLAITTKGVWTYNTIGKYWETAMNAEVEDDCETTWTSDMGANGAVIDGHTPYIKVGTHSQKISPADGFGTGLMAHHDTALGNKTAYGVVRLWICSSVALLANDLQFCIDNSAGCGTPLETINIPMALPAPVSGTYQWRLVFIPIADPTALTAIASIGLKSTRDFGACDIYIDDIQFVPVFDSDITYDADASDMCSFDYIRKVTEVDPWWVFTNGVDNLKKLDKSATGNGYIEDLITSYPVAAPTLLAEQLVEFKDYLILLDTTEDGDRYPQRVRWSDTAKPDDFLNGNASYVDLSGADWIKCAIKFKGDYLVVFKERSVWVGYATGDSDIFQFNQRITGAGCAAAHTVESLGDELVFLGWDDVYVFNGIDYESIGGQIQKELFDTMNPKGIEKCFGVIIEDQKEYWLFVPSTDSDYCDTAWVFNYSLNKWTKHTVSDYMSSYGYYEKQTRLTIGDLVGTIGEQAWRFGDRTTLQTAPTTLLGDTDGYIYEYDRLVGNDDGTAIDGWFSTKDFIFTNLQMRQRIQRMDVYFNGGGSLNVAYSTDRGVTWNGERTLAANSTYAIRRAYWRLDCDMVRFRFRNNESSQHFSFREARLYWTTGGKRL